MRIFLGLVLFPVLACVAQVPDATLPPSSQHAVVTLQGKGVQIYTCKAVAPQSFQWSFVAPAARLFDAAGIEMGTHGDGPIWQLQDGSSVQGQVLVKKPAADAGSVPWLLLTAIKPQGKGALAGAQFIRRSETSGGSAPAAGCDVAHAGDLLRVPYSATYTFYSAK